nr:MAG TPA: hypothetical protein [Caudoviricetes sp.]DAX50426.1 MAG TPA: hypothetical protein [Caudoviricetes sp.]
METTTSPFYILYIIQPKRDSLFQSVRIGI